MIAREYCVFDVDGNLIEDEWDTGESRFSDRAVAEECARRASDDYGNGPYAVTVRVPGPGGWPEVRACTTFADARETWRTDVYEQEMASV